MRRSAAIGAVVAACALVLSACGGAASRGGAAGSTGPTGDPVSGGTMTVMQLAEPRSLDPALLRNGGASDGLVANALYGTLMTYDQVTRKAVTDGSLAQSMETTDGGSTFTLKLRPGLKFSDGTPLTAQDVQFNWARTKDPATGSGSIAQANYLKSMSVVDDLTLSFALVVPVPSFATEIASTSLNWVGSSAALKAGAAAFDAKPIGAGPFTLKNWQRGYQFELAKNPTYFDAPKPYLDAMKVRFVNDTRQRLNALQAGEADMTFDNSPATAEEARSRGFGVHSVTYNGGNVLAFNMRTAPFDDIRAREAVANAVDRNALNQAAYLGKAIVPTSLFNDDSPFHDGRYDYPPPDPARAKTLFDALAADGKPLTFEVLSYPGAESKATAESIQAQLSVYPNVKVTVRVLDFAGATQALVKREFQSVITAVLFQDPASQLYAYLAGDSAQNTFGINDAQLNEALTQGRALSDDAARRPFYDTVQAKFNELHPAINYIRNHISAQTSRKIGGVDMYALGSVRPQYLWKAT